MNDDPLSEHLDNPKAIKEVLTEVLSLAVLEPALLVVFLKNALSEALKLSSKHYSWLLHALRIFCDILVKHVTPAMQA